MLSNLLDPSILFFFLGALAVFIKSDLEIPPPIPKFLSIFLLMAIGLKGGFELMHTGMNTYILKPLLAATLFSFISPLYLFFVLRKKTGEDNAGAIAATFGSVSAVTFITSVAFLEGQGVEYGGYMVAALALMESPAIISGLALSYRYKKTGAKGKIKEATKEALTNGSVVLLLGSLLVGIMAKPGAAEALDIYINDIFKGLLCLFLLDMGIVATRRLRALRDQGWFLIAFSIVVPIIHALMALGVSFALDLQIGDGFLLCILFASASYIAVPAAIRASLPAANPGLFVPMSLGVTFPFNIIVGIPAYFYMYELVFS
jgi:hypothetical protein